MSECDVEIQNEAVDFEENKPLTVFRKDNLIAGSDGYFLNIIKLTKGIDFKKMTPRSKVKENTRGKETSSSGSEDEEQQESVVDIVVYVRQHRTKGNHYHLVMTSLLFRIISVIMQLTSLMKEKKFILSLLFLNLILKYCWTLQVNITYLEILGPITT